MKLKTMGAVVTVLASLGIASNAVAGDKEKNDPGKREYMNKCAVCHGQSGKGDGVAKDVLNVAPSDLTVLSQKNGGVFPYNRLHEVVDGRALVKGHGSRDMPIWGKEYLGKMLEHSEYYFGDQDEMEMYVRARILALLDYLNRIQVFK